MSFPKQTFKDRDFLKFREATQGRTKVAVELEQNFANPIPVSFSELGEPLQIYDEALSVAGLSTETVIDYTVPVLKGLSLDNIHISGDNKAIFRIEVNSSVKYKHRIWIIKFSDNFPLNLKLEAGDNIKVIVQNGSNSVADFNSTLSGNLYDE